MMTTLNEDSSSEGYSEIKGKKDSEVLKKLQNTNKNKIQIKKHDHAETSQLNSNNSHPRKTSILPDIG